MRSAIHTTFGEPADVLTLADRPMPEPGPGQVRIKMRLAPIHNHDLWTVRGNYGYKPELPAIGGSEAVGTIDALGDGVTGVTIGQRVAVASARGSWAEYFVVSAKGLLPVPDSIPDEAAAQLIAMPFSAISLLDFLNVEKGDWVLQNTANGAVGKTLAMLARSRGVHTINLVRRDAGVAELKALGIENAVSTAQAGWQDKVRAIAGDAPIKAAVDSIGGEAARDLLALLGEDGLLVSFGSMGGDPMVVPSGDVIFKQITIKGFWGSKVSAAMPADKRTALIGELVQLVAKGELTLPVEGIFDLADADKAAAASLQPGRKGKILLRA
ncbi:zinc-binding dehydrogenase [Achromobacter sp. GG226]|uniref:zinc-binding dehydrogenase n=1 Tax=Verticiella alkaliphila TaxID=2779529 RepID=UPI001C0AB179|nr:zinc-binding dehydrogenase [Verticiella sp. GG226]MBU4610851.1 zinc-binding dehydrogenase [Verticiella sp. GG226]